MTNLPESAVRLELDDDHVATIEICRPPNNFFSIMMIREIADALEQAADRGARAVVLCSEGKHFCAGADFAGREADDQREGGASVASTLYGEAARIFRQPLPIVAAVQGAAVGGGLGLAMAADFRIGCPEARLTANFARLGFHQGFALSVTLPRVIGNQATQEVLFTGRRYSGAEALEIGLIDRLVDADSIRAEAHDFAAEIAGSAPLAVRSIRETLRAGLADAAVSAMDRELAEQSRLQNTEDWIEGVNAMTERRPPDFQGR